MDSMYRTMLATGDDPDAPERVHVDHRGDRGVVTLDESDRLNVLSAPLTRQLRRALQALDADADVRFVVVTGADPGFSAGGDLKMMKVAIESLGEPEGVADVWRWIRREFGGIARLIARSDTIFIAALNGAAAGRRRRMVFSHRRFTPARGRDEQAIAAGHRRRGLERRDHPGGIRRTGVLH